MDAFSSGVISSGLNIVTHNGLCFLLIFLALSNGVKNVSSRIMELNRVLGVEQVPKMTCRSHLTYAFPVKVCDLIRDLFRATQLKHLSRLLNSAIRIWFSSSWNQIKANSYSVREIQTLVWTQNRPTCSRRLVLGLLWFSQSLVWVCHIQMVTWGREREDSFLPFFHSCI